MFIRKLGYNGKCVVLAQHHLKELGFVSAVICYVEIRLAKSGEMCDLLLSDTACTRVG